MTTIGVLGYGHWGPKLLGNFDCLDCKIKRIVDGDGARLDAAQALYPGVVTSKNIDDVLGDSEIDAVVIALPASLHYETAKKALQAGKHVLVEKPMTDSLETAQELVELAKDKGLVLMVDHHFLYKDSVRELKRIVDAGELGKLQYFDATRINLGLFRPDVSVIWDLAAHDISIIQYLLGKEPLSVIATGRAHFENQQENIAFITMSYADDFIAHINVSWTSPIKDRKLLLGGDKAVALFDDTESTEKLRVCEVDYAFKQNPVSSVPFVVCSTGDVLPAEPDSCNAFQNMGREFLRCIEEGDTPAAGGDFGLSVMRVLDAAEKSLRANGKEVVL